MTRRIVSPNCPPCVRLLICVHRQAEAEQQVDNHCKITEQLQCTHGMECWPPFWLSLLSRTSVGGSWAAAGHGPSCLCLRAPM